MTIVRCNKCWVRHYEDSDNLVTECHECKSDQYLQELKPEEPNTKCYKCESPTYAPDGSVHPLCEECQEEFDGWFQQALKGGR